MGSCTGDDVFKIVFCGIVQSAAFSQEALAGQWRGVLQQVFFSRLSTSDFPQSLLWLLIFFKKRVVTERTGGGGGTDGDGKGGGGGGGGAYGVVGRVEKRDAASMAVGEEISYELQLLEEAAAAVAAALPAIAAAAAPAVVAAPAAAAAGDAAQAPATTSGREDRKRCFPLMK